MPATKENEQENKKKECIYVIIIVIIKKNEKQIKNRRIRGKQRERQTEKKNIE